MTPEKARFHPVLREFLPGDQVRVRELILDGLAEHFGVLIPGLNPDLDDIAAHYSAPGGAFIVADLDGEVIGAGGLLRDDDKTWQMVRLSVASGYRGHGLGGAIVAFLVTRVATMGGARIWTETNDDWDAAIRLYLRHGFSEFQRRDGNVYLERRL